MQKSDAAAYLAGVKQVEGAQASAPTNLHVITGEVGQKSENGTTTVVIEGLVFSEDDSQEIEIDTIGGLEEGDIATVILTGEAGHGMTPLAIGSVGSVDRVKDIAEDAQSSANIAAEAAAAAQDSADDAATAAANAQISADEAASAAETANQNATQAIGDAARASSAAQSAQTSADTAASAAITAQQTAEAAQTSADNAASAANQAQISANSAQTSANNANTHAIAALNSLSTVEDVVDTLTWITEHGSMTKTTDTSVDGSKVYFVRDNNGSYSVGGYKYSIVQEPVASGLSNYYELTIDKSVENYISTHLSLTNEGLWLTPAGSNGYRILIALGSGSVYRTAGTYIIDENGVVAAQSTATGMSFAQNKTFYIGDNSAYIFFDGQGHITIGGTGVTIGGNLTLQQLIEKYDSTITSDDISVSKTGNTATITVGGDSVTISDGATGAQGPKGDTGDQGPQGPKGNDGTNGTDGGRWYAGTGITGTSTTATTFSGSGVSSAVVGDMYLNTSTYNTYRCTVAGAPSVAKWVYTANIKGQTGAQGPQGPQGETGGTGAQGVSVTGVEHQYYLSTSSSSQTGGSWTVTPATYVSGRYYWERWKITFSNSTTTYTTATLAEEVTSAWTAIEQNDEQIALKANATDVYTKTAVDGLISQEVTDRNSAIQVSANAINQTVSTKVGKSEVISSINQTSESVTIDASKINLVGAVTIGDLASATQNAVLNSNVQVGGRNLLRHTNALTTSDLVLTRSTVADSSTIKLTPTTSSAYTKFRVDYLDYSEHASGEYTLSFEYRVSDDATSYTETQLVAYIGFNVASRVGNTFSSSYDRFYNETISTDYSTEWTKASVTVNVPSGLGTGQASALVDGSNLTVQFGSLGSKKPTLIRKVKLEKGNKATDWTPAPEDVDADISDAAKTATNYITYIDSTNGIKIAESSSSASTTFMQLTSSFLDFVRGGTSMLKAWVDNAVAKVRIGAETGFNTLIDNEGIKLRKGTGVAAQVTDDLIELGKSKTSAIIKMCGGMGRIYYDNTNGGMLHIENLGGSTNDVRMEAGDAGTFASVNVRAGGAGVIGAQVMLRGDELEVVDLLDQEFYHTFSMADFADSIPVTLYDNASASASASATLSETAANFKRLTIFFKDTDNNYSSVDVWSPNGKRVSLSLTWINGASTQEMYQRVRWVTISGTTISTSQLNSGEKYRTGQVKLGATASVTNSDYISIVHVIGYR